MYTHRAFVTSVRASVFAPQTAASASLSFFGAKIPFPAFFMAAAFFLALVRFSAFVFLSSAFVIVVFVFVTVVAATVVLVTVIAGRVEMQAHAEP